VSRCRRSARLWACRQRFDVRGIVWFDINQTGGVHHQRRALEGHPGEIAAFRKGLAAWQKAVG
jgi:hypothetical protein